MQPQIAAVLCLAEGTSVLTEGVWDNRYRYVDEFRRMGAKIQVDGKVAVIEGVAALTGAPVHACDLRAGAAMVIAGLAAQGTTEIDGVYHIERGYETLVGSCPAWGPRSRCSSCPTTRPDPGGLTFARCSGAAAICRRPFSRPGGRHSFSGRRHMEVCTLASGSSGNSLLIC